MATFLKWLPYLAILVVYATGANLDIMEIDAAQYAHISLEMLRSGEFLQVFQRHEDYLDKPPLLFWVSTLSFKLFGVGSWQYKLPSILFSLIGVFSTFKLGQRLYSSKIGHHAAMIFGGSLAMIMINNDVKTDTILVASIVFSIWMLISYIQTQQWRYLIGAAFGIAAAMLTKGPIGLMMPALAIGGHLLAKRDWKLLFDWKWIILLFSTGFLLIPMCVGLYEQYGSEGLKFYFWTQSFGRITGDSTWQNDTTPLFFIHVFLWSFLPWTLIGLAGLINEIKNLPSQISSKNSELYLISGILLVWIALSSSRFKLPHYIFVVYPLITILAAKYINGLHEFSRWAWAQLLIGVASVSVLIFVLVYCFPNGGWIMPVILGLLIIGSIVCFRVSYRSGMIVIPSFILSIGIGLGLNCHFYPQLLPYQANSQVGQWIFKTSIEEGNIVGLKTGGRALDFYARRVIPWNTNPEKTSLSAQNGMVVYASQSEYDELIKYRLPKREVALENFEVQNLTVQFLNPKTRHKVVKKNYLLFY
jgi:4-amino-4-deoxy-L-arabinose transferase-like glycosyltransferase